MEEYEPVGKKSSNSNTSWVSHGVTTCATLDNPSVTTITISLAGHTRASRRRVCHRSPSNSSQTHVCITLRQASRLLLLLLYIFIYEYSMDIYIYIYVYVCVYCILLLLYIICNLCLNSIIWQLSLFARLAITDERGKYIH